MFQSWYWRRLNYILCKRLFKIFIIEYAINEFVDSRRDIKLGRWQRKATVRYWRFTANHSYAAVKGFLTVLTLVLHDVTQCVGCRCVQLISIIFLGFGIFLMTSFSNLVNKFLESNMEAVEGKLLQCIAYFAYEIDLWLYFPVITLKTLMTYRVAQKSKRPNYR